MTAGPADTPSMVHCDADCETILATELLLDVQVPVCNLPVVRDAPSSICLVPPTATQIELSAFADEHRPAIIPINTVRISRKEIILFPVLIMHSPLESVLSYPDSVNRNFIILSLPKTVKRNSDSYHENCRFK